MTGATMRSDKKVVALIGFQRSGTIAFGDAIMQHLQIPVLPELFLNHRSEYENFFSFWTWMIRSGQADSYPEHRLLKRLLQSFFDGLHDRQGKAFVFHLKVDQMSYVPSLRPLLSELGVKFINLYRRDNLSRLFSEIILERRIAQGLGAHDVVGEAAGVISEITLDPQFVLRRLVASTQEIQNWIGAGAQMTFEYDTVFSEHGMKTAMVKISDFLGLATQDINVAQLGGVTKSAQRPKEIIKNYDEIVRFIETENPDARYIIGPDGMA